MANSNEISKTGLTKVIAASSVGTMIEWYDFYIFGSLAGIIAVQFFPKGNPTASLLSTLAVFAAGFVVRPFGAIFFGRLGDLMGRKFTFFLTLLLMGGATFAIGLIPGYQTIGVFAPIIVLILRLLQGLALGGEYGGATTYVGEHSPPGTRGFYTSWIQTTATVGLFVSLVVVQSTRSIMSVDSFESWGWRIPFLISIFLLLISAYIRYNMQESPMFARLKSQGKVSKNPLKESFTNVSNMKYVLLALLGAVMGQGVVWYTGQFYALRFLRGLNVDFVQTNNIMLIALAIGTPFFIVFGALSDKIGRKWIMVAGLLLAVFTYRPIYRAMHQTIHHDYKIEVASNVPDKVSKFTDNGTDYMVTNRTLAYTDGSVANFTIQENMSSGVETETLNSIKLGNGAFWRVIFLILIQVLYVTMCYGPIAAFLIELFPTKIRYTSMSLPYHIGNGVFGGLVPLVSTALVVSAQASNRSEAFLEGLWYPIGVAFVCAIISIFYINKRAYTRGTD